MATNLAIDEKLLAEALSISGLKTKRKLSQIRQFGHML